MGIDGIGGKGPPVPPAPAGGAKGPTRPTEATRPFEAPRPESAPPTAPVEGARGPLEKLRAGEIDVDGYLDAKVHEATAHLGPLPASALADVRAALRDRMATDPTLAELARTAAGRAPSLPED